jgi:hypothetical protein
MVHLAAQFPGLCAAGRHIGVKNVPPDAPLALLMERIAAHFGRFPTNEPTIEPTKTQESDERTQDSDERTQDSANEPKVRLVAPGDPRSRAIPGIPAIGTVDDRGRACRVEPERADSPERP